MGKMCAFIMWISLAPIICAASMYRERLIKMVFALDNLAIIGIWPSPRAIDKEIIDGPKATTNIRANRKKGSARNTSIARCTIKSVFPSFNPQYIPISIPRVEDIAIEPNPIVRDVLVPWRTLLKISRPNPSVPR